MKLVRIGAAALNQTPLAWDSNRNNILAAIDEARAAGVSLLCLPELCVTGYGCEDAFHSDGVRQVAKEMLAEIVPETTGITVAIGVPLMHSKSLYSAACLASNGRPLGFVAKQHLASEGIHYEPRWFAPWAASTRSHVEFMGESLPFGDLLFDVGGVRVGFEICEDAWAASRPGRQAALAGADLIMNPSASHFAFGKQRVREGFVADGSRAFGVAYVYANLLGNEAGRVIYDGGSLIATEGQIAGRAPRFSFADRHITSVVVDISANRTSGVTTSASDGLDAQSVISVPFAYPTLVPQPGQPCGSAWETGDALKEEEFSRAVALGLFDYLRKSRARGFVVSLSGGADSSAVSCLVSIMVKLATEELGAQAFRNRLGHISGLGDNSVKQLLTCVFQSTRNSSETTRTAARQVAEAIGADFVELDVDDLVEGYKELAQTAVGRPLTWEADDLALQNIQARARGPSVWLLANIRGALLLATSNRSEAAVGYATMDGDTCGGLSPIAGIDKAFLRHWLRWLQSDIPALAAVNDQAPTAELRPPGAHQTDEDDLMPYEVLDAIEGAAILGKHAPLEVFLKLRPLFPDISAVQLRDYVQRFFVLWCRNQWKRERYAPSFHLDDKNLDPRSWCRFPILSGGYQRELAELREYVAQLDEPAGPPNKPAGGPPNKPAGGPPNKPAGGPPNKPAG